MIRNKIFLFLTILLLSSSLYGQSFIDRLMIGGNIIGCRQDRTSRNSPGEGVGPGAELFLQYNINNNLFVNAGTGFITATDKFFGWDNQKVTLFPSFRLDLGYNFVNTSNLSTYINAGVLGFKSKYEMKNPASEIDMKFDAAVSGGLGLNYKLNDQVSLNASGSGNYALTSDVPEGVTKPLFWFAKMGFSYSLNNTQKRDTYDQQRIEYPFSGDEIALDDIFNTEEDGTASKTDRGSVSEEDALDLLFQAAEEESGSEGTYDDLFAESTEQGTNDYTGSSISRQINELSDKINERDRIISELRQKVNKNEEVISRYVGKDTGTKSDTYTNYVNNGDFTNLYKQALQLFYDKKYDQAINRFQNLMNSNPNHKLASNCQYWIGESYNAQRNYRKALDAFKSVLNYNKSYKFDDALIMNGVIYMKIGEVEMAKRNFQQLVQNYPDSEYAPKAMRYLGRL